MALLARLVGELDPDADEELSRRRHRLAARRLAATAVMTAATVHGAFGDRPDLAGGRSRAARALRARAPEPTVVPSRALGAVARLALELPAVAGQDPDWQLGAIAFADEELLRALYAACVELAASAARAAAAA